jgi:hypothetical protein
MKEKSLSGDIGQHLDVKVFKQGFVEFLARLGKIFVDHIRESPTRV